MPNSAYNFVCNISCHEIVATQIRKWAEKCMQHSCHEYFECTCMTIMRETQIVLPNCVYMLYQLYVVISEELGYMVLHLYRLESFPLRSSDHTA